jgi:hypothetical protein
MSAIARTVVPLLLAIPARAASAPQEQQQTPLQQTPLTIEELERRIAELEAKHAEELEDVRFELETLHEELALAQAAARSTTQSASVFNPGITVFGNFVGRWDDQPVFLEDDPDEERIDDRFNLREVEVDFRAAIDPWADGVLIAVYEAEAPNEFEAEVEEGYAVLKKLPLVDAAPWGLRLKVGRFRPEFGRFNYIHLHDLPQPSYPRALGTFLGEEGFIQNGVSGQFYLPFSSERQSLEATVQVLDGGNLPLAEENEGNEIATLGHVKLFRELGETTNVELGASAYEGDSDHQLYGLDATYKWKPLAGGEWRSFLFGGEAFVSRLDDPALGDDPLGYYAFSQYQLNRNSYVGVRYDHAESLEDEDDVTDTVGLYVTYYTTEFLRFRIGVEHTESDIDELDDLNTALIELNTVFGSHPVEPYWVNR